MKRRDLQVNWNFQAVIINSVNQAHVPTLSDLQLISGIDAKLERQALLDGITIIDGYCPETHARYEATEARKAQV